MGEITASLLLSGSSRLFSEIRLGGEELALISSDRLPQKRSEGIRTQTSSLGRLTSAPATLAGQIEKPKPDTSAPAVIFPFSFHFPSD
jgi:hypothetical protein